MCTILLVEDDHKLRPKIVTVLDEAGYSVVPSGTVTESLALIGEHEFDLAIVDLKLPNGDGMEVVRQIHDKLPIIVLTGYPSHEARNEASVYGVSAFLTKPYNEEDLVTTVDHFIYRRLSKAPTHKEHDPSRRKVGDEISTENLYAKMATVSSRVATLTEDVQVIKKRMEEQNGVILEMKPELKTVMERTQQCADRGALIAVLKDRADKLSVEDIAVLKEKAAISGRNWGLILNILVGLISTGAAVLVTRAANQLASALLNAPVP